MSTFLTSWDRKLPFGTATVIGATAFAVGLSGAAAVVLEDSTPATVAQAPAPAPTATKGAAPKPKPTATKVAKPDSPDDYLLDVEKALPGWDRVPDAVAGVGKLDIGDAAKIEAGGRKPTENDREALRKAGFVRGHARAWESDDGVMLVVLVYEWKNGTGPTIMVTGMRHVNEESESWQPAVPRSYGVCRATLDQIYDAAIFASGKHSFLVVTMREDGSCTRHDPVAKLAELTQRHAAKLGA